jgi:hypothetical protein
LNTIGDTIYQACFLYRCVSHNKKQAILGNAISQGLPLNPGDTLAGEGNTIPDGKRWRRKMSVGSVRL